MADAPKKRVNLDHLLKKKAPAAPPKATAPASAAKAPAGKAPAAKVPAVVARERRVQGILASIDQLPSLPAVVWDVMKLANDPDSCASDFEEHIKKDQALTAKLLKLVNSAYFGLPNPVTTISRSVVVLGYKTLKSVVMAASTSKLLDRQLGLYGYSKGGLWMHSIACAGIARHLASKTFKLGLEYSEEAFVAGLLHDIGKIVISPVLYKNKDEFLEWIKGNLGGTITAAEKQVAGIDHAEAGQRMMQKWKLPPLLSDGIASHHDADGIFEGEGGKFNALLQLANYLCHELSLGVIPNYPWNTKLPPQLLQTLQLKESDVPLILEEASDLQEDIQALFSSLRA